MAIQTVYAQGRIRRRVGKTLKPSIAILALAAFLAASSGILSSCREKEKVLPGKMPLKPQRPLTMVDIPTIRVRLTPRPMTSQSFATTSGYRIWAGGKLVAESRSPIPQLVVSRAGADWRFNNLQAAGGEAIIEPLGGVIRLGVSSYRGRMRLLPVGGDGLLILNHVDLESYLAGVLPKELYPYWSIETYRALAVAARTFALYQMRTAGVGRDYDLGDDQGSQVYGGYSAETDKAWEAVTQTQGRVLVVGAAGNERIFPAQYSAACGGLVNPAYVLRDLPDIQPLRGGQKCDDCRRCDHYRWPTVRVPKAELYRAIVQSYPSTADIGGLSTIRVTSMTASGRPVWLDVYGPSGKTARLRAEDLRMAILRSGLPEGRGLFSMNCRIVDAGSFIEFADGRGYGHGVGLCQWGAEGKAAQGWRWDEILNFYYPGAKLMNAY